MSKTLTVLTTFVVFGVYTHGALAGKVNPKASCEISMWGESFKECKSKLVSQTDSAFYRVKSVVDHARKVVTQPEEPLAELEKDLPSENEVDTQDVTIEGKTIEEVLQNLGV